MSPLASLHGLSYTLAELVETRARSSTRAPPLVLYTKTHEDLVCIGERGRADAKGLSSFLAPAADLDGHRAALEERVRSGDAQARAALNALLPLAAFGLPAASAQYLRPEMVPSMAHAPDLYPYILQSYLPALTNEDHLPTVLRSTFTFFTPSKRMQKRAEWGSRSQTSLVVFLRACLPTLLSLYEDRATKDLDFDFRVAVYARWHALLGGTHRARAAFFQQHRLVLTVCFSEFFAYYVTHVHPMSPGIVTPAHAAQLFRSYTNIAQTLRTELNLHLAKHPRRSRDLDLDAVLAAFANRGQLMIDRGMRFSKAIACKPTAAHDAALPGTAASAATAAAARHGRCRRTSILEFLAARPHALFGFPYTRDFAIFTGYCERHGIEIALHIVLWQLVTHFALKPLTVGLARAQLAVLAELYGAGSTRMANHMTHTFCVVCSFFAQDQKLRYNPYNHQYVCARCAVPGTVLALALVGRLLYVHDLPYVLSPHTAQLVLFSPLLTPAANEVPKNMVALNPRARKACHDLSFGAHVVACPATGPHGRLAAVVVADHDVAYAHPPRRHCSFCRSLSLADTRVLIDTQAHHLVLMHFCSRHVLPAQVQHHPLRTVADYWRIEAFLRGKRRATLV